MYQAKSLGGARSPRQLVDSAFLAER
jgi:hypothetical protein